MSYLTFLLLLVPPIALLVLTLPPLPAAIGRTRARYAIPLVCLIALVYTTPWDNYLVYREVWSYGADRVLATIGYVPVEEYLFFLLQPLFTGLVLYHLLSRAPVPGQAIAQDIVTRRVGAAGYLALSLIGAGLLLSGWHPGVYLGLILAWAGPVLAGMWWYAGGLYRQLRTPFVRSVAAATLYLWIADGIAIRLEIWDISNRFSLGWDPLGLPIEEAVFFLLTNLLVVQGVLLFLYGHRLPTPGAAETTASS